MPESSPTSSWPVATSTSRAWVPTRAHAIRIAFCYGLLGALWILGSGWALHLLVPDQKTAAWLETLKGWFYVGSTAVLLGWGLDRYFRVIRQSVERAQQGEMRLQLLGDNLPDSYVYQYTYDLQGRPKFTYVSAGAERVHGIPPAQILEDARELHGQLDTADHARFLAAERESARTMSDFSIELRIRRPDGDTRLLQLRSRPQRNSKGQVRWDGFAADITKIRQAELEARAGEDRLRLFIENAPVALAMFDREMRYLAVSRRWKSDFHLGNQDLLGRSHYEIFPEIPDALKEIHCRAMQGEVIRGSSEPFVRLDGSVQWVDWEAQPWRTSAESIGGIIISSEEVTEHKRAEEERSRLAAAMEQAVEAICITDLEARILYVNPAFEKTTGYTRLEALGQTPSLLNSGKQDARFYQQLWSVLRRGEVWKGHLVNRRKDGSLFEEEATISPVRDHSGVVTNYVAIKLDVTAEMALKSELRQVQKLEAIGQLAGGVAHDFNNILAVILMQADQALEEPLSSAAADCVGEIKEAAERASSLTRQLLLFSRRQVMQPCLLDLNEAVTNLAKMLRRLLGENVSLRLDLHAKPLWIHADSGMLDQVLLNLSVNARDAMQSGGRLTIATGATRVGAEVAKQNPDSAVGHFVWLSVHDEGCGIPAEILPRIFEPFFTTKQPGLGTGLGLATVFGIVKQHQGWIDVRSEPGQGATFQVFLPASKVDESEVGRESLKPKPRGGREIVLLVEDEPSVSRAIKNILVRHGYQVVQAAHGKQAVALAQQSDLQIDLLLTDMVLPEGMSGMEIAVHMRARWPGLKVVFMSGYSPELAERPLVLGEGEGFIQKPFESEVVLSTIRRCLES